MPEPRKMRAIAAVVLVLAIPLAVAWAIGETTITNVDPKYVNYVVRPPNIPEAVEQVTGALSAIVVVAATAALAWSWKRDPPDPGFLSVLLPLVVVGVILGVAWRIMTAAVIGANIGATLLVLFGSPVILALVILAGVSAWLRR